jgi:RIO-like serine/threonine protein kinase
MKIENQINLTPLVSAVLSILSEPYQELVARLHREGRITDAEVGALRASILERSEHLAELVKAQLQADREGEQK